MSLENFEAGPPRPKKNSCVYTEPPGGCDAPQAAIATLPLLPARGDEALLPRHSLHGCLAVGVSALFRFADDGCRTSPSAGPPAGRI
jgi:hypothetical protein